MRVRCTRILEGPYLDEHEVAESPFLTIGREYIVLSVDARPRDEYHAIHLQIWLPESGSRFEWGMWPADMFVTTSGTMPSNWVAEVNEDGYLMLAPESWLRPFWWDDLDPSELDTRPVDVKREGSRQAWDAYRRERNIIVAESL